ncbi:hypothetical protein K502DRAFT_310337 [Neoconidiobolus thromboides FSU 785]|nr:hypothetical protein K502DRAFT_310337 [Neoconidiobolus thromboides FSU 785]
MKLEGSCHCKGIKFTFTSSTPVPYNRCYCSICRKVQGGGGYAINIMGAYSTLEYEVNKGIELKGYKAIMNYNDSTEKQKFSGNTRYFCGNCSSNLWAYDPTYKDYFYPFASAIDSELPNEGDYNICHIKLNSKASWVSIPDPNSSKCSLYNDYPTDSIENWHKKNFK